MHTFLYSLRSKVGCYVVGMISLISISEVEAQSMLWSREETGVYYTLESHSQVYKHSVSHEDSTLIVSAEILQKALQDTNPIQIEAIHFFNKDSKILIFYNALRVWRLKTKGSYCIYDINKGNVRQLGKGLKNQSLGFAQVSPNMRSVAYTSENNVYLEDINNEKSTPIAITTNGSAQVFNGTFDWSYEEEFQMRDGIRWSADGRFLAFWQINAQDIPYYILMNTTDSVYPTLQYLPYPKVGYPIAKAKIFYYDVVSKRKIPLRVPPQPSEEYFITQLEPYPIPHQFIFQVLNRTQQKTKIYRIHCMTGNTELLYSESNKTWLETEEKNSHFQDHNRWHWVNNKGDFLYLSENGAYRHLVLVGRDTRIRTLTPDTYDVMQLLHIDTASGNVFFMASPANATQAYLYSINYKKGKVAAQRITPSSFTGYNSYTIAPDGKWALHRFSSHLIPPLQHYVTLPLHQSLSYRDNNLMKKLDTTLLASSSPVHYFTLTTEEGIKLDGWMRLPDSFDRTKKYPVLFYVYGEPASQTTLDRYSTHPRGSHFPPFYKGVQNFIYVALDNRGSPAPKGLSWRKAIYKQLGTVNVRDQALGAQAFLQRTPYADPARVGVWGASGGGSVTLHLLFKYPEIYKMGISIAPLTDLRTYDNIYEERYMGLISDTDGVVCYREASPINYARQLQGKLLLIHGTADDNVHYQNSEMLINELIKNGKVFQFMAYPKRTHSLNEGGKYTREHLRKTFTNFVQENLLRRPSIFLDNLH